jgi:biotin carboxylase
MSQPVVIGFADALAAIESAWALADEGFEVCAFARRGTRPALARCKGVNVFEVTPPEVDAAQAVADIAAVARSVAAAAILPLDDFALWLCEQLNQELPGGSSPPAASAVVAGPTAEAAVLALDKRRQLSLAEVAGFSVPPTVGADEEPPGPGPWMVKPALAVQVRDGRLCRPTGRSAADRGQIRDIAARIDGPSLVQPLITGTGEGIFGFATPSGLTCLSAHQRIRMMNPRGSGSSACRSVPVAADIRQPVCDFMKAAGWRGLFMIELLRDADGTAWFMELNGRAWGSMALACRRGYNYPAWAVRQALDQHFAPDEPTTQPEITVRHLGREMVHLGAVIARGGAPRLTTVRSVLTVRKGEDWYNLRAGQKDVFLADAWNTIRSQLRRDH